MAIICNCTVFVVAWVVGSEGGHSGCQDHRDLSSDRGPYPKGHILIHLRTIPNRLALFFVQYTTQARLMVSETPELYREIVKPYIDAFPASRTQWYVSVSGIMIDNDAPFELQGQRYPRRQGRG